MSEFFKAILTLVVAVVIGVFISGVIGFLYLKPGELYGLFSWKVAVFFYISGLLTTAIIVVPYWG